MKKLGKLALIALTLFVLFNVTRCAERCTYQIFCRHQFTNQGANRGAGIVKTSICGSGRGGGVRIGNWV